MYFNSWSHYMIQGNEKFDWNCITYFKNLTMIVGFLYIILKKSDVNIFTLYPYNILYALHLATILVLLLYPIIFTTNINIITSINIYISILYWGKHQTINLLVINLFLEHDYRTTKNLRCEFNSHLWVPLTLITYHYIHTSTYIQYGTSLWWRDQSRPRPRGGSAVFNEVRVNKLRITHTCEFCSLWLLLTLLHLFSRNENMSIYYCWQYNDVMLIFLSGLIGR